jgi:O-acetyl-ADP-ribose deacetylase (regulator of RNase III)
MMGEKEIKGKKVKVFKGDISALDVEAFVFYARHDLQLGSGVGNAIALRGGSSIQEELNKLGSLKTGEALVSAAGKLKAKFIVHAVGPRFQEEDIEGKLKTTIQNALKKAEEKEIKQLAFPAMGVGFYGVPLALSAKIMIETIKKHLEGESKIKEVLICANDLRELKPFQEALNNG